MEEMTQLENSENVDGDIAPPATNVHSCPKCSRTFINIGHMKCHFYRVHPEFKLTDFVEMDVAEPNQSKTCKLCKTEFHTKKELKTHDCAYAVDCKSYQCDQCHMKFAQNTDLIRHCFRVHRKTRDHICEVCKKGFTSPAKLTSHMHIHEFEKMSNCDSYDPDDNNSADTIDDQSPVDESSANTAKFLCEVCGQSFRTSTSLKSHVLTHEEKTFQCDTCSEFFSSKRDLKDHSRTQHPVEKSFVCETCNALFASKAALGRHSLIHNEEKSHLCEKCNVVFATKQSLIVHLRKHAKSKPFACGMCDKKFALKCHLARHLPSHHNE